jgi:hypothetical protein
MALEYRLTLAGTTPVNQVAERALPTPEERPTGTAPLLSADLYERYGFAVTIRAGQNDYMEVESDDGMWEWKPNEYVSVLFRLDKLADRAPAVINVLTVVRRILSSGTEDAALVLNDNVLLLTRFGGVLVKHRRDEWWDNYPGADA